MKNWYQSCPKRIGDASHKWRWGDHSLRPISCLAFLMNGLDWDFESNQYLYQSGHFQTAGSLEPIKKWPEHFRIHVFNILLLLFLSCWCHKSSSLQTSHPINLDLQLGPRLPEASHAHARGVSPERGVWEKGSFTFCCFFYMKSILQGRRGASVLQRNWLVMPNWAGTVSGPHPPHDSERFTSHKWGILFYTPHCLKRCDPLVLPINLSTDGIHICNDRNLQHTLCYDFNFTSLPWSQESSNSILVEK